MLANNLKVIPTPMALVEADAIVQDALKQVVSALVLAGENDQDHVGYRKRMADDLSMLNLPSCRVCITWPPGRHQKR